MFQSSPALSGRCNGEGVEFRVLIGGFNPHRPFRAGATRCENARRGNGQPVSILTGPFGPVQLLAVLEYCRVRRFQSSPALSGRCNRKRSPTSTSTVLFQSSPALSGRCNVLSCIMSPPLVVRFQSSPALSGRCNAVLGRYWTPLSWVSILTGPFGPVQRPRYHHQRARDRVSILTGPFGPVQQDRDQHRRGGPTGFNPHRPFRAGATAPAMSWLPPPGVFQSSPALSGRCNQLVPEGQHHPHGVSILTGPFGPVQPASARADGAIAFVSILTGPFGPVQHGDRGPK